MHNRQTQVKDKYHCEEMKKEIKYLENDVEVTKHEIIMCGGKHSL